MYDFQTVVSKDDSAKWLQMKEWNPNVKEGIIPFTVADMELKHPPELIEGLKEFLDNAILGYAAPTTAYTNSVINWMEKRHNWGIKKEWIIETPGVINAFFSAVGAFTDPGDGVILMSPVYYPFYKAIERNDRKVINNNLVRNTEGSYEIDFQDLEEKAKDPRTKLLLFCSPHNPVGRVWKLEELKKLGEICNKNGVLVLSDEIHFDLIMPGYKHIVYACISNEFAQNCIICTAPSKTFNLAGMQVSNIVIPNENIRRTFLKFLLRTTFHPKLNMLGYKACEIVYTQCDKWLDQLNLHILSNSEIVTNYMKEHLPMIKVTKLEGTYLLWMDFRAFGLDNQKLESIMHHEAQVFFDEGYIFGCNGSGFERMNLACPTKPIIDAMNRLKLTLAKYI